MLRGERRWPVCADANREMSLSVTFRRAAPEEFIEAAAGTKAKSAEIPDFRYATQGISSIYALDGIYCIYAFNGIYCIHELPAADPSTTRETPALPAKRTPSHPGTARNARRPRPNSNRKNRSQSAACQRWTVIQNFKRPRGASAVAVQRSQLRTQSAANRGRLVTRGCPECLDERATRG